VLRLMHDNQLLSPFRPPPRPASDHDGTILTLAPDVLWALPASTLLPSDKPQNGQKASDYHNNPDYHVVRTGEGESTALPRRADGLQIRSQGRQRKHGKLNDGN
jgi:hypothetical protein